jgi:hypothetical protein
MRLDSMREDLRMGRRKGGGSFGGRPARNLKGFMRII